MLHGWIDLEVAPTKLDVQRLIADPKDGARRFRADGIAVEVNGPDMDLYVGPSMLTIACGEPRFRDPEVATTATKRGLALAWFQLLRAKSVDALATVDGHFSVVAFDASERRLILATDRFGVFPLCYGRSGRRLGFADRADLVPFGRDLEIELQAIFDYFYFHVIPAPRTVFRDVFRVEGGHALLADPLGQHSRRYWVPRFEPRADTDMRALAEEFRDLLRKAVAREANADAVGCYLSGGTDSSTVSGMLTEIAQRPVHTFSIGFEAEGYDEIEYARTAARHFGTEHHEHYLSPDELAQSIPQVAAHFDQPFGNSSAVPAYCCARVAHETGVRKLLAGDGGDELFGGNTRYAKQKVFASYEAVPEGLRRSLIEPLLLGAPAVGRLPLLRKVASYVRQARTPMPDRMEVYNLLARLGAADVLEPDFLKSIDPEGPRRAQRDTYSRCAGESLVDRMLEYDWKYTLADNDLPKVRETATLAGVNVGFPLLDDELVRFSMALPPRLKVNGLKLRYFFKEALRGFLPDAIIAKRKHGFGLPFGVWLIRHRRLLDFASNSLTRLGSRGIVRASFIDTLISRRLPEHPAFYGEMIWIMMMLEEWLSARADARMAEPIVPISRIA